MTTTSKANRYGECACCGARIDLAKAREAELAVSGRWYAPDTLPESEESQGLFDLGAACYRRVVRASR